MWILVEKPPRERPRASLEAPLTWGTLCQGGRVRGSPRPWFDTDAVRRGPDARSSPEAAQRCAAGAGLDGADQAPTPVSFGRTSRDPTLSSDPLSQAGT